MAINPANAAAAYKTAARAALPTGGEIAAPRTGPSFSSLVENAAKEALSTSKQAEALGTRAAAGANVELTDVVTAVANAEVTLQTVVAVRDKVISAYQDIMRMPI
jgi:flagellar hook-basal body complex protein FliE